MRGKRKYKALKIVLIIVGALGVTYGGFAIVNASISNDLIKFAKTFSKVEYINQKTPEKNENNEYYFTTDDDFRIMHLTDIHLGAGFLSKEKDKKALNAIASMVTYEKPDLVVLTGDNAFPVPFISGSFNDAKQIDIIANLFETLGVYWTTTFGNHDSEAYSYCNREKVASIYTNSSYTHCLFTDNVNDIYGHGNQIINIYNTKGLINKSLFLLDSNSYLSNDAFGLKGQYDNVHENQIKWYSDKVNSNSEYNIQVLNNLDEDKKVDNENDYRVAQSFIFQHIPVEEYSIAYDYATSGTGEATLKFGTKGENVCSPIKEDDLFETMVKLKSTKAMFCGHDHVNNYCVNYQGIDLTYGYSIDYLAYKNIDKYGSQRGCTLIKIKNDTSYEITHENYYQDKYITRLPKETVNMGEYKK